MFCCKFGLDTKAWAGIGNKTVCSSSIVDPVPFTNLPNLTSTVLLSPSQYFSKLIGKKISAKSIKLNQQQQQQHQQRPNLIITINHQQKTTPKITPITINIRPINIKIPPKINIILLPITRIIPIHLLQSTRMYNKTYKWWLINNVIIIPWQI